jgi:hypothetical protein
VADRSNRERNVITLRGSETEPPEMTRTGRIALSMAVVVMSLAFGLSLAILVTNAIPGVQVDPGFVEATPVHLFAFPATFVFVTFVSALLGLLCVWRC